VLTKLIKLVKFIIAWFRIPKGMYCYFGRRSERCPYWYCIADRPSQANGWCDYLGKGDIELTIGIKWTNVKTKETMKAEDLPFPTSLLWDKCKECGINDIFCCCGSCKNCEKEK